MANKYLWTRTPGNRRWRAVYNPPFYDTDPTDRGGNYNSLGQLVGSMRGISAPTWEEKIKRPPTAQDMQSITAVEAENIYFRDYWDAVKGDDIQSQKLAELIADVKSSTGNVKILQKTLGQAETGRMNTLNVEALNVEIKKDAQAFFLKYRANLVSYYSQINNADSHLRRLDRDYPASLKIDVIGDTAGAKFVKYLFIGLGVLLVLYLGYKTYSYFFKGQIFFKNNSLYI